MLSFYQPTIQTILGLSCKDDETCTTKQVKPVRIKYYKGELVFIGIVANTAQLTYSSASSSQSQFTNMYFTNQHVSDVQWSHHLSHHVHHDLLCCVSVYILHVFFILNMMKPILCWISLNSFVVQASGNSVSVAVFFSS